MSIPIPEFFDLPWFGMAIVAPKILMWFATGYRNDQQPRGEWESGESGWIVYYSVETDTQHVDLVCTNLISELITLSASEEDCRESWQERASSNPVWCSILHVLSVPATRRGEAESQKCSKLRMPQTCSICNQFVFFSKDCFRDLNATGIQYRPAAALRKWLRAHAWCMIRRSDSGMHIHVWRVPFQLKLGVPIINAVARLDNLECWLERFGIHLTNLRHTIS
jgi:hypothetical protein